MGKDSRFVGLDVHADTIAVAVAEPSGEVRALGTIPNTPDAVRRLVKKLAPDAAHEALRDLVRAREAAKQDQLRARHRLANFLLRHGRRMPPGSKAWGRTHRTWLQTVRFDHGAQAATLLDYVSEVDHAGDRLRRLERAIDDAVQTAPAAMRAVIAALQALRGIAALSAVTIVTEVGTLSRFARPRQLMGYSGAVSREYSSGLATRRGAITKTGNAHLRRIIVEAAWTYQHRPAIGATLRARQRDLSEEVTAIAWKAQHRLHRRYGRLLAKGTPKPRAVMAVARELLGFIWAIGVQAEQAHREAATRAA